MSTAKRLILIRHAHRDTSAGRELDNGLSKKGKMQARRIAGYLMHSLGDEQPTLISSPTKRCRQTLKPFAKERDIPLETTPLVYEQNPDETWKQFERRIRYFCTSWEKSGNETTIVCSHGDWIPSCVFQLAEVGIKLKKGGLVEFVVDDDGVHLHTLLQSLKPFSC